MEDAIPHRKLFGLDHLRALAIILVVVFHYGVLFNSPEWIKNIGQFGWTGVDLFFVLSGYLIAAQLFATIAKEKNIALKTFFIKRFFRIIPAYLVVLSLYFLFPAFREKEALQPLWRYLTFTQNLWLIPSIHGTFSHAWSLCIEEQFYFFLPLLLIALLYWKAFNKGYLILIALFIFGIGIRLYSWNTLVAPFVEEDNFYAYWSKWIYYPTYCRLDGLLIGVAIAALYQFRPIIKTRIENWGNYYFYWAFSFLVSLIFSVQIIPH